MRCGLLSILALAPLALADVEFIAPAAGASIAAGAITVQWQESGVAPLITSLQDYTITLMVGGNDPADAQTLVGIGAAGALFSAGNEATGTITPTLAQNLLTNGFYLQIISTAKTGGTVTNYSPRFTLTGMTGTTAAEYVAQVKALAGSTAGPPTVNDVAAVDTTISAGASSTAAKTTVGKTTAVKTTAVPAPPPAAPAAPAAPVGASEYSVPYNLQTGLYRYAPMQPIPPTKITADKASPLFPTSAFDIARAALPIATIVTTYTQAQTFSVQSVQNTIAAQPQPRDDMARYLARWKD